MLGPVCDDSRPRRVDDARHVMDGEMNERVMPDLNAPGRSRGAGLARRVFLYKVPSPLLRTLARSRAAPCELAAQSEGLGEGLLQDRTSRDDGSAASPSPAIGQTTLAKSPTVRCRRTQDRSG